MQDIGRKLLIILIFLTIVFASLIGFYFYSLSEVNKDSKKIIFEVKKGSNLNSIVDVLENEGLIRSALVTKIYIKINSINDLKAGTYELSTSMGTKDIINRLGRGSNLNLAEITITFPEGKNMRQIAKIIASKTNNKEEDVFNLLKDNNYIDSLIKEYDFLDEIIKDKHIYYPLEGYLSPDTYKLKNQDVTVKEIFTILLNQTEKVLANYEEKINNSNLSIHEILTLASLVEAEAITYEDRQGVAKVFLNRIKAKMSLGSDVTTYYAFKIDMGERDLYNDEIKTYNPYNTRGPKMEGKLPIGPINNPNKKSIEAVLNPSETKALYFVADINRKVYFTDTINEHNAIIKYLKDNDLWFTW